MGLIDFLHSIAKNLPEVSRPQVPPTTKEKLMWTGIALVLFFIMYNVTAFGAKESDGAFDFISTITASRAGSLLTTGIGPIVLASIFLQLFVGAGLINLNMQDKNDKKKFHEVQKILAIILALVEAAVFVYAGRVALDVESPLYLGLGEGAASLLIILQITLGSVILLYLDEIVSKYGVGSGISLFIAAGVAFAIIVGSIALIFSPTGVIETLTAGGADAIPNAIIVLMPLIFTAVVFFAVVYAEGVKVEIPIAFQQVRGVVPKLPLKYFYVSNIPVIFASALIVNIQIFAGAALAEHESIYGIVYMVMPIYHGGETYTAHINFLVNGQTPVYNLPEWLHAITYILFLSLVSVMFGLFWVETSNMDAKSVANQLMQSGLQIPGWRRDPRMLESILNRYIFPLTVLGSFSVGLLAGFADLTGAIGTGTGILLTVGILYRMYEQMEQMKVFDVYPALGGMLGA